MPKFMAGQVIVKTYSTFATTPEEAREHIKRWQESDSEEPEGGITVVRYKLGWEEFADEDPEVPRNKVLAAFLNLMQNVIPGWVQPQVSQSGKTSVIVHPFERDEEDPLGGIDLGGMARRADLPHRT